MSFTLGPVETWFKGLVAALVSGASGGVLTALGSMGIRPDVFNLTQGLHATLAMMGVGALINAIIGVAGYLQKSPVPPDKPPTS